MRSRIILSIVTILVLLSICVLPVAAATPPSGTWVLVAQGTTTWPSNGGSAAWFNYYTSESAYYMFTTTNMTYSGASGTVTGGVYGGNRSFTQSKTSPYTNFFKPDPNLLTGGTLMTPNPMGYVSLTFTRTQATGSMSFNVQLYQWYPSGT